MREWANQSLVLLSAALLLSPSLPTTDATYTVTPEITVDGVEVTTSSTTTTDPTASKWIVQNTDTDDWALQLNLKSDALGFRGGNECALSIEIEAESEIGCLVSECRLMVAFGDGSSFFTVVASADSVSVFPQCLGDLADGDISTPIDDADFNEISGVHSNAQWPLSLVITNADDGGQSTMFWSDGSREANCSFSSALSTDSDLTLGLLSDGDGAVEALHVFSFAMDTVCAPTASPTVEPTANPSVSPVVAPTIAPTLTPTEEPTDSTAAPSNEPTAMPSVAPSSGPTSEPTDSPTTNPSRGPSSEPTVEPTASPSTPSPLHSDELVCGQRATGEYANEMLKFEVRMSFLGRMRVDATASDFELQWLESANFDCSEHGDGHLTMDSVPGGSDVVILLKGTSGSHGTWTLFIECESMQPTKSPTEGPSTVPTAGPTAAPVTPSPLHPGQFECGQRLFGFYDDEPLKFEVRMLFDGVMTFDASASDVDWTVLKSVNFKATDSDGDGVLSLTDLPSGSDVEIAMAAAEGSSGRFSVVIRCEAPTARPTAIEPMVGLAATEETAFVIDASDPVLWLIVAISVFLLSVIVYLLCCWKKVAFHSAHRPPSDEFNLDDPEMRQNADDVLRAEPEDRPLMFPEDVRLNERDFTVY